MDSQKSVEDTFGETSFLKGPFETLQVLQIVPDTPASRTRLRVGDELWAVNPIPATHSILTVLKAGETVCETL